MQSDAFYKLREVVIAHLKSLLLIYLKHGYQQQGAMAKIKSKSKATLQKLRDEGQIMFTQPKKNLIIYDVNSINYYLNDYVHESFEIPKAKKRKG